MSQMIQQQHARILREALAYLYKHQVPAICKKTILVALADYSRAVAPYCECSDLANLDDKTKACLDCGRRHNVGEKGP